MEKQSYKRGRVIINPRFQFKIIGYALALGVILTGALYSVNVLFFNRFIAQGLAMGLPPDNIYFQFIDQQKAAMTQSFAGTAVFLLSILAAWAMIVSHRIAGPIYRLCNDLAAMKKEGKVRRIKFRQKDFFPELEDAVNSFLAPEASDSGKHSNRESKSA